MRLGAHFSYEGAVITALLKQAGTQPLITPRLTLRRFAAQDSAQVFTLWASDAALMQSLGWTAHCDVQQTACLLTEWVDAYTSAGYYHWAICRGPLPVGDLKVVRWHAAHAQCELGFLLCRSYWGQGLMAEALTAATIYLLQTVGFERVEARHAFSNPRCAAVLAKAGFIQEGRLRHALRQADGTYDDLCIWAAVSDTWKPGDPINKEVTA